MGPAEFSQLAARALSYGALMLAAGLPIYLLTAGREVILSTRLRLVLALLALIAAVASVWLALTSVAAMAAMELGQLDRVMVEAVLAATPLGLALEIKLTALALMVLALVAAPARWRLPLAAVTGGVALASSALTGHAGATLDGFGTLHRLADAAHMLAAATWLAALATFIANLCSKNPADGLAASLARFARTGTALVLVLIITGIVNTLAITGWPIQPAVFESRWTLLLTAKLALFATMLGLAAINRWLLTPALERGGGAAAPSRLRLSLAAEATAGTAIILLVSQIGLLDPAG